MVSLPRRLWNRWWVWYRKHTPVVVYVLVGLVTVGGIWRVETLIHEVRAKNKQELILHCEEDNHTRQIIVSSWTLWIQLGIPPTEHQQQIEQFLRYLAENLNPHPCPD